MGSRLARVFAFLAMIGLFAEPVPAAQSPSPKGQIVIAMSVDTTTLDISMVSDQTTAGVLANIYEGLTARKTNSMEPVPLLAESWKLVNDTTWEFKLRKGVKFHNGEDFNAESVKFTLDRNREPDRKAPHRSFIDIIKEVRIVDPYTVRIITSAPSPILPTRLTGFTGFMLPPRYVQEKGDQYLATHPVGTGPFRFVERVRDDHMTLEANVDYWGGAPKVGRLIFRPMPEASARIAAIQTGAADIVTNIPPDQAAALSGAANFSVEAVPSMLVVYLGIDSITPGPLAKREVRQAINYAIDRYGIVKNILRGFGKVSASAISEEVFSYDGRLRPYPYDPAKAKQLLREAGYADGFPLTIHGPSGRYSMDRDILLAVAQYLQNVGIKATVKTYEWGAYAAMRYGIASPGGLYMLGWGGSGTFVPELAMAPLFRSGELFSTTKDTELDRLLDAGARTMDQTKRASYYKEAQRRIYTQAYRVFLHQQYYIYGVSKRVKGWVPRSDEFIIFVDATTGKVASVE